MKNKTSRIYNHNGRKSLKGWEKSKANYTRTRRVKHYFYD